MGGRWVTLLGCGFPFGTSQSVWRLHSEWYMVHLLGRGYNALLLTAAKWKGPQRLGQLLIQTQSITISRIQSVCVQVGPSWFLAQLAFAW